VLEINLAARQIVYFRHLAPQFSLKSIKNKFFAIKSYQLFSQYHILLIHLSPKKRLSTIKTRFNMFGIDDILIILPYLLGIACVIYSAWYGIRNWNKD